MSYVTWSSTICHSNIELNVSYVTWSSTICHSNIELNVSYVTWSSAICHESHRVKCVICYMEFNNMS